MTEILETEWTPHATHPDHWRRHGHEGEPCPTDPEDGTCYGGERT